MSAPPLRIVFLDMDGVLNNRESMHKATVDGIHPPANPFCYTVDPECVQRFRAVVESVPGTEIVISSSWRYSGVWPVINAFQWCGWNEAPIRGMTDTNGGTRGDQIYRWLAAHRVSVHSFAILDDDSDFYKAHRPYHVRTENPLGFRNENAAKLKQVLSWNPCLHNGPKAITSRDHPLCVICRAVYPTPGVPALHNHGGHYMDRRS